MKKKTLFFWVKIGIVGERQEQVNKTSNTFKNGEWKEGELFNLKRNEEKWNRSQEEMTNIEIRQRKSNIWIIGILKKSKAEQTKY